MTVRVAAPQARGATGRGSDAAAKRQALQQVAALVGQTLAAQP